MDSSFVILLIAGTFVLAGNLFSKIVPPLSAIALPGAVVGGLFALAVGPQLIDAGSWALVPPGTVERFYEATKSFPGLFINAVFACLMLGRRIEPFGRVWNEARSLVVMGHIFAWGQYVVGLSLALLVLEPLLGVSPLAGALIAIGFQGGHGTAAGLGSSFAELGFAQGEDLGMAIATIGVLSGVVGGPFLAASMVRRSQRQNGAADPDEGQEKDQKEADAPQALKPNPLTGRLTVHVAVMGITVGLGWWILDGIQTLEKFLRADASSQLFSQYLPLFSVVLLAGMGVQLALQAVGWDRLFDRDLFEKVGAFALDMVIFGALANLSLAVIGSNWLPLLLLGGLGLAWNLAVFFFIGPRVYDDPWFARGLGDLGGGTATTACGILLINVADPDRESGALEAYAQKQPFYEPIMGGGLVTALALPTIAAIGTAGALAVTSTILFGWCLLGWRLSRKHG